MPKSVKQPIGECQCMARGCELTAKVYKYDTKNENRKLFAGKLYAQCEKHGRFGWTGQPSSQGALEYILENAKMYDPKDLPAAPTPAPTPTPAPAPSPAAPRRSSAPSPTPTPTPSPAPRPAADDGDNDDEWAGYRGKW